MIQSGQASLASFAEYAGRKHRRIDVVAPDGTVVGSRYVEVFA